MGEPAAEVVDVGAPGAEAPGVRNISTAPPTKSTTMTSTTHSEGW